MTIRIFLSFFIFSFFTCTGYAAVSYPDRFAQVDEYLYRGARPTYDHLLTLRNLYLVKTIVSLDDNPEVVAQEKQWATQLGMNFYNIPLNALETPSDLDVNAILTQLIRSSKTNRVYLHCKHGKDRTGMISALYRVFYQNWNKERAYDEMLNMGFQWLLFPLRRYYWYRVQNYP